MSAKTNDTSNAHSLCIMDAVNYNFTSSFLLMLSRVHNICGTLIVNQHCLICFSYRKYYGWGESDLCLQHVLSSTIKTEFTPHDMYKLYSGAAGLILRFPFT